MAEQQILNIFFADPGGKSGVTFHRRRGFAVLKRDSRLIQGVFQLVDCRRLCLEETTFVCQSFELLREAGLCTLSTVTSEQAGLGLVRWNGYVFEEWTFSTGGNCVNIGPERIC